MPRKKPLHCRMCNSPRKVDPCFKCGSVLHEVHPSWTYPRTPPVKKIRALAKEVGYAIGVHGSLERDLDIMAMPWSDDAVSAQELAEHIAKGLNGNVFAPTIKPLGRWAVNINIRGWYKLIDLSVAPRVKDGEMLSPVINAQG